MSPEPSDQRPGSDPGSLSSPAPPCPTSTRTTGCWSPPCGPRRHRRAGRLGRPGGRLGRLRPGRAPLALGLPGAARRRSWPGRRRVPRLANPADIVGWNTDKRYLRELAAAGIPVTPDRLGAARHGLDPRDHRRVRRQAHGQRRQPGHRPVRPRPTRPSVHLAVAHVAPADRRRPDGDGPALPERGGHRRGDRGAPARRTRTGLRTATPSARARCSPAPDARRRRLYWPRRSRARTPTAGRAGGRPAVLAAVPGGADRLLYARVDLIPGRTASRCCSSWS